jgi:hypothetical protein
VRVDDERGSPPFVCALGGSWGAEYDFDVANRSAFNCAFLTKGVQLDLEQGLLDIASRRLELAEIRYVVRARGDRFDVTARSGCASRLVTGEVGQGLAAGLQREHQGVTDDGHDHGEQTGHGHDCTHP